MTAAAPAPLSEAAPAKLNLALHVRRRRDDGYHDIETLFAFCADGDMLSVVPDAPLSLHIGGPFAGDLANDDDNLVLQAARTLGAAAGVAPRGALTLDKRLPVASGIGGGSADAAAALRLLNRTWGLNWPAARLAETAMELGADVPACVHGVAMRGDGVGDRLAPVDLGPWHGAPVLLVNPCRAVSTGAVFAAWDGRDRGPLAADVSPAGISAARNDLAPPARDIEPAIDILLQRLETLTDAYLVRMSGSGATCFAIFASAEARDAGQEALRDEPAARWMMSSTIR
ncbi:MAG: 4-(cytidine 5'-diphospho)-2-C-methyl-D-erythritol kinase [Pseudomonadota bacterium]